ncbi:KAP family NTPase [Dyadobacter chenwenxiniae]|uniref:KAP family NTPase n=1 Tax=Dyadobacter chenwenxiniae TaxID=2906456 RepID=A0A9X1PVC4_9BACT|nr:P-loop NTPase fold protein [Dyadobacter chenwenxiniae]MCF0065766.1 KAP family NTPase [Dyadobacter chenwenxiniae]UON84138.1 KAP family NTPase [Dyadobacter chenwenxiniae]
MDTKKNAPTFLENKPIGEDLFEGKSQDKIANVLIDAISKESFKIIGIEGAWGTGKSNLVQIMAKKLTSHKFFIYDVWGHQEDDQRRAILVELTDFITNEKSNIIKNKEKWENKLKSLLSKQKETTTTNIPYLSMGFIFSLLSIIYIPSVNAYKDSFTDYLGIERVFWKAVLLFFPIIIVSLIYTYYLCINIFSNKKGKESFKLATQDTFQIYTNKQKEETKIETISENEPSVKDFRNWMKDIDNDLENKKLIIIFDNLDRLPKKQILSIWSSIHVFFSEESYKNIKVLIPFDRQHIHLAFQESYSQKVNFANDYIDKTFDLVYRVSLPILSNWKGFFKDKWKKAQLYTVEEEYLNVEQIFDVFQQTITPRSIIAFINEVVSLKRLYAEIPDRYISLFVLNKEDILSDPLKAITSPAFLSGLTYKYGDDEDFQRYVTALAYQIDPNNSLEIVYRKKLRDSLINNNPSVLAEIAKTAVFNQIISPALEEIEDFERPILALTTLDQEETISTSTIQGIWDDIYLQIRPISYKDFSFKEYEEQIVAHISIGYKKAAVKNILDRLINHSDFDVTIYTGVVDKLTQIINESSIPTTINEILTSKTIKPETYIELINVRKGEYLKYNLNCPINDIDLYLTNLDFTKLSISNISTFDYLYYLNKYSFPNLVSKLELDIEANKQYKDIVSALFQILKIVKKDVIESPFEDSELYSLFSSTGKDEKFYLDLMAMRIQRTNDFSDIYESIFEPVLQDEDQDLADRISELIEYYVQFDKLLLNSLEFETKGLYSKIVLSTINRGFFNRKADVISLLYKFEELCITNNIEPQRLLKVLDKLSKSIIDQDISVSLSHFYFSSAISSQTKLASNSIDQVRDYYNRILKDEWISIFNNFQGREFNILMTITYQGWNTYAVSALRDRLMDIISANDVSELASFRLLIDSMEASGKNLAGIFKDVRDKLIYTGNSTSDFFNFFADGFFKHSVLLERADDVLRAILAPELFDNQISIRILGENHSSISRLLESGSEAERVHFVEALIDRKSKPEILELARHLNIDV